MKENTSGMKRENLGVLATKSSRYNLNKVDEILNYSRSYSMQ